MTARQATSPRRTATIAFLVAVLALLMTGCGGDDDGPVAADGGIETTTSSTSGGDAGDGPGTTREGGAPSEAAPPVVAEAADVPAGWESLPIDPDGTATGSCIDALAVAGGPFAGPSVRAFAQSNLGAFLVTASAEGGQETVAEVEQLVLDCDGQTDDAGYTTSIETADAPGVGTGAVAFRGTATHDRGSSLTYLVASTAVGDTALLVVNAVSLGELDPALVEKILAAMAERAA